MKYETIFARLVANTHEPENYNGCWEWKGKKLCAYGYGRINFYCEGVHKAIQAHAAMAIICEIGCESNIKELLLANIEIRHAGLEWKHLCCNRKCINPDHLELVTPKANSEYRELMRLTKMRAASRIHTSQHETESKS